MIHLRSLEREDLKQLCNWRNDPEIFSRVREYRYLNMENQEAWFGALRDDRKTIMFGIQTFPSLPEFDGTKERECKPILIGVCGLTGIDWVGRKAEVSIYIGLAEQRGKGHGLEVLNLLATYAFGECNLNRLYAEIFAANTASERLFLKAGYKKEGTLRCHSYKNGMFNHCHIYGLLRSECLLTDVHVA